MAPLLWSMLLWRCKSARQVHDILHHSSLRPEGGTSLLPGPPALTNIMTVKKKMGPAFINSCWTRCNFYQSTISFKSPASTTLQKIHQTPSLNHLRMLKKRASTASRAPSSKKKTLPTILVRWIHRNCRKKLYFSWKTLYSSFHLLFLLTP